MGIRPPSPDRSFDPFDDPPHDDLGGDIETRSLINGPDWWRDDARINALIPIDLSWHDQLTHALRGGGVRVGAATRTSDNIEHPLRVGAPVMGVPANLLLASPLSTLLSEPASYRPRLLEEPTLEELEDLSPLFYSNIIPIAGWLFDFQIMPSYRHAWLPGGNPSNFSTTPSSVATTTMEITWLQHRHRQRADTEIQLLHEELTGLNLDNLLLKDQALAEEHLIHGSMSTNTMDTDSFASADTMDAEDFN